MKHHTQTLAVYYDDTDAGGVVYHTNYIKWAERCRTDLLKAIGLSHKSLLQEDGIYLALRHLETAFHKPAMLEDELTVETHIRDVKKARLTFYQRILRNDTLLTEITCEICAITKAGKPKRLPVRLIEGFKKKGYM